MSDASTTDEPVHKTNNLVLISGAAVDEPLNKTGAWAYRARQLFIERGYAFKPGTNQAKIYELLERPGGRSEDEIRMHCRNPDRASSILTDVCDVATISGRKVRRTHHKGVVYYGFEEDAQPELGRSVPYFSFKD